MAVARIASNTSPVKLLDAAPSRDGVIITNDDANRLYVLLDSGTASTTNYSFSLAQNENAEVSSYEGAIYGIWASAGSGGAQVTTFS